MINLLCIMYQWNLQNKESNTTLFSKYIDPKKVHAKKNNNDGI